MDNNKLGLQIVRISQGLIVSLEINEDQRWTKNVGDIREDLKNIENLDGSSAVLMLTSVDTGHLLTVASLIGGRPTDCISAWIYVPASINIAGKELVEIVDAVKKEILANKQNEERLKQLFSKSYGLAPATRITAKSNGEKFAYRYYGQGAKYTLSELLNDMCQSYYTTYKSVFLLDKESKLKCLQGDDLSDQKVYSKVLIKSPGNIGSFVPYIDGQPFVGQRYAIEGGTIDIEWRRNGYRSITTTTTIAPGVKLQGPTPDKYVKVLNYNYIKVFDERGQCVTDYDLYVAKQRISKNEDIYIPETKLNNVQVEIHAEGFKTFSEPVDLTQPKQLILGRETYTYKLPLGNGEYYSIQIPRPSNKEIKNSPVKGYVTENGHVTRNDTNYLRYKPFTREFWITCLIYSIIVLLLGICGGYFIPNDFIGGKEDNQEVSKLKKENADLNSSRIKESGNSAQKGPESNNNKKSKEEAISYLDNNDVWNKTEMEKYEPLKGLWNAMNERDFRKIQSYKTVLGKSKRFEKLLDAIGNSNTPLSGNYNKNNKDFNITIELYIKSLDDAGNTPPGSKGSSNSQPSGENKQKNDQDELFNS